MPDLDPRFTFEHFVVGPANRLASAAARRAAENPGASYNPLFLYASSGLGKTHILGAIAHHATRHHPDIRVEYETLEGFLAKLAQALGGEDAGGIRARYESLDVLLMDDVQFLTGQSEAQEMLLRTLDVLAGQGRQVVLTSDRPPSEIDGLDARLRSRFEGGLLVDIGPPEYETRVAIIRKKAEARGQPLNAEVADIIGRIAFRNVRELSGALNRVLAIQELEGRTVGPEETALMFGRQKPVAGSNATEVDRFLDELSNTVAAQVEARELPWRKLLRETAEEVEAEEFRAHRLRRLIEKDSPPEDARQVVREFRATIQRLKEIRARLEEVGNPWPEAAHGVLRDPERLEEAEALLASAQERARPFPKLPEGPELQTLASSLPQLVIRAAEQLVRTDRPEYSPLYVWSPDGVAARLLLEAAGRSRPSKGERGLVAFASVAEFAQDFIHALSAGVAGAWRERWWSTDLLLIHGIQDLSGTERAQEEFFHLFEALQRKRARLMVAADRPPAEIAGVDDRVRSRFEGGLVLEIPMRSEDLPEGLLSGPSLEARRREAVLREKSRLPASQDRGKGMETSALPEDLSITDREWIMSFGPGAQAGASGTASGRVEESAGRGMGAGQGAGVEGAWIPSGEEVIWDWPRMRDRIVEDPD
jgi:chromosomal replication initiator protein